MLTNWAADAQGMPVSALAGCIAPGCHNWLLGWSTPAHLVALPACESQYIFAAT